MLVDSTVLSFSMHMYFLGAYLDNLLQRLHGGITAWTLFGLLGNVLFSSRFFVQWYISERQRQSVIPVSFWWLSLVGSIITSIYAIHLGSVPYILGVLPPTFIYARNLILIRKNHCKEELKIEEEEKSYSLDA